MPEPSRATAPARHGAPPPALVRGLRRLLRPLVRLLLAHQITHPYLANLLKRVYVELADAELAIPGKAQTISRLSLLTGIHRKDVKRLREEVAEADATPPNVSLGAQLVARWTGARAFQGEDGRPLPLPRLGGGGGPDFEALIASVSKDIRARAVLDEWLRLGVVHLDAQDRVCLNVDAFVPESGFDEKAHFFGRNLHDHIAAAAHNLEGEGAPLLERSVCYDGLSPESVAELAELAERGGMEALQAVNRRALELQQADEGGGETPGRINFGIYFFRDRSDPEEADDV